MNKDQEQKLENDSELKYTIIGSGSTGNSVVIENVMVDCGLPYKRIKEYLYNVDYLLITHIHGDHIKDATYKRIRKEFPNIITVGNWQVSQKYDIDVTINAGYPEELGEYVFEAFECVHDVITYGYTWRCNNQEIIYATDTNNFNNAPDKKYDYFFLESNYDKAKINALSYNRAKARRTYGYDVVKSAKRHASTQTCRGFYYNHRRTKDSELIELHKSSRFY